MRDPSNPAFMTMEEYKSLPEGTLAELIDNVIYMSPSPNLGHSRISLRIASEILNHCARIAEVFHSPCDVYLDEETNAVQPDVLAVLNNNPAARRGDGHFHGVPDLIVEILSPGNRNHDRVVKKALYEKFGVKEYWIVDPSDKLASGYFLVDGKYQLGSAQIAVIDSPLLNLKINF